jgi:hypothetical protein
MSVPPYRAGWGDSQAEGFWEGKKFEGRRQKGWVSGSWQVPKQA